MRKRVNDGSVNRSRLYCIPWKGRAEVNEPIYGPAVVNRAEREAHQRIEEAAAKMDNATPKPTTNALADELEALRERLNVPPQTVTHGLLLEAMEACSKAAAALRMPTKIASDSTVLIESTGEYCPTAQLHGYNIGYRAGRKDTLESHAPAAVSTPTIPADDFGLSPGRMERLHCDLAEAERVEILRWKSDLEWGEVKALLTRIEALAAEKHRDEERIAAALKMCKTVIEKFLVGTSVIAFASEVEAALTKRGATDAN